MVLACDPRLHTELTQRSGDRLGPPETAAEERQPFHEGDKLHRKAVDIRLFDHQPASGREHAQALLKAPALVGKMMEGIHDQDTLEAARGEGEPLGVAHNAE